MKIKSLFITTALIASIIYAPTSYADDLQGSGSTFAANFIDRCRIEFAKVGTGSVIPGWDIGLKYFAKGGKGSLYIPSMLAYGPQANGNIKAYENLAFDIEIKDVNAAPAAAPKK